MPIKAACSCGHRFQAASKYAGKTVKCPKCKNPLKIPAAKATSKKAAAGKSASAKIAVKCKCGKAFSAKPELAGKKVKCPGCGDPIVIKAKSKASSSKAAKSKAAVAEKKAPSDGIGDLFDEVGFAVEKGGGRGKKCPECKSPMKEEAILCIDCGYNENIGKKMETYRPVTATDRAKRADVLVESEAPKGGKKSRFGGKRGGGHSVPSEVSAATTWLYVIGFLPVIGVGILFLLVMQAPADQPGLGELQGFMVGYAIAVFVLNTGPCLLSAFLIQKGKFAGIIIAYIIGALSLFGFPIGTFLGWKVISSVSNDVVRRHCS